jgi:hypothetical protein
MVEWKRKELTSSGLDIAGSDGVPLGDATKFVLIVPQDQPWIQHTL